ncbi:hypothetical protein [Nocardia sp. NBC_00403]|uniref:hypothetical protein n=1 Tax=Nocardia sp. NBC_00403 TaxID=2975990 RepID=UPI002E1E2856
MRRGVLALLGVLAVIAAAPAATAATGDLTVGGVVYSDPSGCINLGIEETTEFVNDTNSTVTVYRTAGCTGAATAILAPGVSGTYTGQSVQVG